VASTRALSVATKLLLFADLACACGTSPVVETPPPLQASDAAADGDTFDATKPALGNGTDIRDASAAHRTAILFASTCSGGPESFCHSSNAGNLRLLLVPDGGDVIRVPSFEDPSMLRVRPGDSANSFLFRKVLEDGGVPGGRMPLGERYDPQVAALLRTWIDEGAPVE
jgi:hypothetical protein